MKLIDEVLSSIEFKNAERTNEFVMTSIPRLLLLLLPLAPQMKNVFLCTRTTDETHLNSIIYFFICLIFT
jgi:hypothetical protein